MQTLSKPSATDLVAAARIAKAQDLDAVRAFDTREATCCTAAGLAQLEAASVAAMEAAFAAEEAIVNLRSESLGDVHTKVAYLNEYARGCAYDDYCERLVKSACADIRRLCGWTV